MAFMNLWLCKTEPPPPRNRPLVAGERRAFNYQANCGSGSTANSARVPAASQEPQVEHIRCRRKDRKTSFFGGGRMADKVENSSSMTSQQGATERSDAKMNATGERSVVAEFVDAAQSAAESLLQEQKQQIADRVSGVGRALEGAAHSLDETQNRVTARYVQQAGEHIRSLAHALHDRRWNELVAETEDFARRQPTWFVLGAVAAGFLVGRFLWGALSEPRQRADSMREASRRETTREVTAAISSAPGTGGGTGDTGGHAVGSSGMMESR
jgi:hypothetical protein